MTTTEQTLMNIAAKAWCSAAWARMAIEDQYAASTFARAFLEIQSLADAELADIQKRRETI
ncbi:MAG: hypothetical protein LAP61_05770 [Acidobacteriia bacterium]|nr:hypothetical protein [Terriglobia bacterium]